DTPRGTRSDCGLRRRISPLSATGGDDRSLHRPIILSYEAGRRRIPLTEGCPRNPAAAGLVSPVPTPLLTSANAEQRIALWRLVRSSGESAPAQSRKRLPH